MRVLILAALFALPAAASTPGSWQALDKRSGAACLKAANLKGAVVAPPVHFSDKVLVDARVVTGKWPQPHMKGAAAAMLCLYNRRTRAVEVQELPAVKRPAL